MIGDIETLCKLANIKLNLMKTLPPLNLYFVS